MATSKVSKRIATPKKRFAFDLRKPIMRGNLLKQGGFHKAFKQRYFILYPGFLVYYDHPDTWKYDLQRGETLGSRLGAIKLKGGFVEKAKDPPRGAKYAFVINCPDPLNKRRSYMFNCQSNEERYQWITKTSSAIPSNDTATTAPQKQKDEKKEEETISKETDIPTSSPASSSRERHETVDEAALLAVSDIHEEDTKETHIDEVFGPRTSVYSTSSEEEDANDGPEVVSTVSVTIDSPILEPKQLQREPTEIDVIEIVIPPRSMDPNLSNEVIEPNSLSSDESSDSEKYLTGGSPNIPLSPNSTPPPSLQLEIEQNEAFKFSTSPQDSEPPVITIDKSTLERQPNSATKEDKENGSPVGTPPNTGSPTPDRRRPSGALVFIEKRGFLYKMGGIHKNWHRRFFVLQPGVFYYYKSELKGRPLGEVKLKNTKIILPQQGEKTFSSYQFTIHTESSWNKRSDWVMAASNENEMKEWVEAFKSACGILTTGEDNGSE